VVAVYFQRPPDMPSHDQDDSCIVHSAAECFVASRVVGQRASEAPALTSCRQVVVATLVVARKRHEF